jgi:hypothetical protein
MVKGVPRACRSVLAPRCRSCADQGWDDNLIGPTVMPWIPAG